MGRYFAYLEISGIPCSSMGKLSIIKVPINPILIYEFSIAIRYQEVLKLKVGK